MKPDVRKRMRGNAISSVERDEIMALLRALPLPEVHRRTGRSFTTLARIAEVQEKFS